MQTYCTPCFNVFTWWFLRGDTNGCNFTAILFCISTFSAVAYIYKRFCATGDMWVFFPPFLSPPTKAVFVIEMFANDFHATGYLITRLHTFGFITRLETYDWIFWDFWLSNLLFTWFVICLRIQKFGLSFILCPASANVSSFISRIIYCVDCSLDVVMMW